MESGLYHHCRDTWQLWGRKRKPSTSSSERKGWVGASNSISQSVISGVEYDAHLGLISTDMLLNAKMKQNCMAAIVYIHPILRCHGYCTWQSVEFGIWNTSISTLPCCEVQELCVLYDGRPTSLGLLHPPLTLTCVPHVRLHLLLCYEEDTFVLFGALCWHVPVPYHGGCGTVG